MHAPQPLVQPAVLRRRRFAGRPGGRTSSCTPGGRPSLWHAPESSTSSTRSGALHLAFRWSSIRYFCLTFRVHRRLGLYWQSPHTTSPQPVDLHVHLVVRRRAHASCASPHAVHKAPTHTSGQNTLHQRTEATGQQQPGAVGGCSATPLRGLTGSNPPPLNAGQSGGGAHMPPRAPLTGSRAE